MITIQDAIDEYLTWSHGRHTPSTIKNYNDWLKKLTIFLGKDKPINDITVMDLSQYQVWLKTSQHLADSSIAFHMIVLRNVWRFMYQQDRVTIHWDLITVPKYTMNSFVPSETGEMEQMLDAIFKYEKREINQYRDATLLLMLYSTGARVSEVIDLDIGQLELADRYAVIVSKKNRRKRQLFWDDRTETALLRYMDLRKYLAKDSALFVSFNRQNPGKRLTTRSAQRIIEKYRKLAGIDKPITPHSFRHGFAMDAIRNKEHPRVIQLLLGHNQIGSSQVYMDVKDDELRESYKKLAVKR